VLRFLKNRVPDAETPSEALERGIPGYGGMMRDQPDDVWDYVRRIFRGSKPEVATDEPEFKMSSKKLKAHVRVLHQQGGGGDRDAEKMLALVVAAQISTIEESDSDFGVIFMCTLADEKHMLRAFLSAIKGFRILDPDEEDEDGDDDGGSSRSGDDGIFVDSTKKPEEWREARKKKLIPGWEALDTEHYLIVYNKDVKRALLRSIAVQIEAIRRDVYANLFPPAGEMKAISVVRVCKDREEYNRYGGPGGSAGYWSRGDEELVF
jgi:hypothetical protein